jgi:hypothetical protein
MELRRPSEGGKRSCSPSELTEDGDQEEEPQTGGELALDSSDQVPSQAQEPAASTPFEKTPCAVQKGGFRLTYWLLLTVLFFGALGAGLWAGRSFMQMNAVSNPYRHKTLPVAPDSNHVIKGLFCPVEGGDRTLRLSLSLRTGEPFPGGQQPIKIDLLCEVIYEAVQTMGVKQLSGEQGMKALKTRIVELMHGRYPHLKVEDIQFLDYTIF